MRPGQVYSSFTANGKKVTLRALRWEDIEDLTRFINNRVGEKKENSDLGIIADKIRTREQEAEWLAKTLLGMERGELISVLAEVDGRVVANSEVNRGTYSDTHHHRVVGITALKEYRGLGIGLKMMETLVGESRKTGLKTLQLEAFDDNTRAIHVYEKAGFREVGRIPKKMHRGSRFFDSVVMVAEL